jgi:hypothetical protein
VGPGFHPQTDDIDGVPVDLAICRLRRGGSKDAKQANNGCRSRWSARSM